MQHAQLRHVHESYMKWGFGPRPSPQELVDALLPAVPPAGGEPIEWNRIGFLQDVTMRVIAERLLPDAAGTTFVDRELINGKHRPLPKPNAQFHVYCSPFNAGATEAIKEAAAAEREAASSRLDEAVAEV